VEIVELVSVALEPGSASKETPELAAIVTPVKVDCPKSLTAKPSGAVCASVTLFRIRFPLTLKRSAGKSTTAEPRIKTWPGAPVGWIVSVLPAAIVRVWIGAYALLPGVIRIRSPLDDVATADSSCD